MPNAVVDYSAFRFDKYSWSGKHNVPWLTPQVGFIIDAKADGIPPQQRKIVEFVCNLPATTKASLEQFLFKKYQAEIYGSIDPDGLPAAESPPTMNPFVLLKNLLWRNRRNEVTPRITKPQQIWKLISSPGVHTPPDHRIEKDCYFQVCFECVWDPEHGIAVLFNDRGEPIALGGQGSHF